ncbi:hypothetical protein [Persephonella sp.]
MRGLFGLFLLIISWAYAQSPFGVSESFVPGSKVIYQFDGSNCPVGDVSPDFEIIFKSYDCVDYKGVRWIRPLEAGTFLYKSEKFPDEFSIEFDYYAFKEGKPYVKFALYSPSQEEKIKKRELYTYDAGILLGVLGSIDEVNFGFSETPVEHHKIYGMFKRSVKEGQIHRVQISVKDGRVTVFIDGKRAAKKPVKFQVKPAGFGIFFYKMFSTDVPFEENPALIGNIKISAYTGEERKPAVTQEKKAEKPVIEEKREVQRTVKEPVKKVERKPSKPVRCIKSIGVGEAAVIRDYSSAKMEAFARAKWDAIEKALGTDIQVKSVLENFKMLDEVILKDVKGFIRDVKIIDEKNFGDAVQITIEGCVYPREAEKALSLLSRNTAFNVLLIVQKDRSVELDEMNPVTTNLINILNEQGFEVYDFAGDPNIDPYKIEKAISQKRFITLRNLFSRNLAGATIIGKIKFIPKTRGGQDIGYGIKSAFNVVLAQAQYYLLVKDKGKVRILASGSVKAKGTAPNIEEAENRAMESLSQVLADDILKKIDRYLASKRKVVTVQFEGIKSVSENFEIKSELQKLPWVKSVEDIGKGKFRVEYLENPVYLANALESILGYTVGYFSPTRIVVRK